MKTFRQLREAFKKEENPEAKALRPRAEGERDFYDSHTREVKDYPVKSPASTYKQDSHHPDNGDRSPIQQGTSKLGDKSGFKGSKTPMTRADKTQGDFKPVRNSPSSVQTPTFGESVFVNQPIINESDNETIAIELLNGDIIEINEDIFNALVDTYEQLNTGNRVIFKSAVNESIESFEKILDFIISTQEGEDE